MTLAALPPDEAALRAELRKRQAACVVAANDTRAVGKRVTKVIEDAHLTERADAAIAACAHEKDEDCTCAPV